MNDVSREAPRPGGRPYSPAQHFKFIRAYCADCGAPYGDARPETLHAHVICPQGDDHYARVIKDPTGEFWLRVERRILRYEHEIGPLHWQWLRGKWGLRGGWDVGRFLMGKLTLLALTLFFAAFHPESQVGYVAVCGLSALVSAAALFDVVVTNISIAFISRLPASALRSAVFTIFAFVQVAMSFAIFFQLLPATTFNHGLRPLRAVYFSVVTISTLGYGDIIIQGNGSAAAIAQLLVISELLLGLFFLSIVLAIVTGWAAGPPKPFQLVPLRDVLLAP